MPRKKVAAVPENENPDAEKPDEIYGSLADLDFDPDDYEDIVEYDYEGGGDYGEE